MRSPERVDGYAPIRDYAVVGNKRTAALVALDGAIDWLCLPRFDSPSVFGALLDPHGGGRMELAPAIPFEVERRYLPDTNLLETTFSTSEGKVRVTDWMSVGEARPVAWNELVRRVDGLAGAVPMRWRVAPRFDYGRERGELAKRSGTLVFEYGELTLGIHTWGLGEPVASDGDLAGERVVREGDSGFLALTAFTEAPLLFPSRERLESRLEVTAHYWRRWANGAGYSGRWRDEVVRSILALDLLVHEPDASMIAAVTTSLPEQVGGSRNYDYRLAWVRDTTFALDAMLRLGYADAVQAALAWLIHTARRTHPRIHTFYGLDGRTHDKSEKLDLPGYRGSTPVLVGNDAGSQLQLGNFGDLLQTSYLFVRDGNSLTTAAGRQMADSLNLLVELWRNPDSAIWELPDKRDYTQGKMASWLAFHRGLQLVEHGELPGDDAPRWRREADALREFIDTRCFDPERNAWKRAADTDGLDASVLLVAGMDYVGRDDPRLHGTIDAVRRELGRGPLLYRYSGMEDQEGCFLACSFWLVEALARTNRVDEAIEVMEGMLPLANDVGLFSEEMDPDTKEMLGNFPQALTHLSLLNAAFAVERAAERVGASE